MIRLDTNSKLQMVLQGTQQLKAVCSFSDQDGFIYTGGNSTVASNGTTAVDIVSAPAANIRDVDFICITNHDNSCDRVTIQLVKSGTTYVLFRTRLNSQWTLTYTHGSGWSIIDKNGVRRFH